MILRDYLREVGKPEPIVKNPRICTESERQDILVRDNFTCRYCGAKDTKFHIDHVYPYSLGGLTIVSNLVTACDSCNRKKNRTVGMWPKPIGYFDEKPVVLGWKPKAKLVVAICYIFISLLFLTLTSLTFTSVSFLSVGLVFLIWFWKNLP